MGMSCEEVEPMIGFLLDNELDPDQSQDVEDHLETCESCRAVLEEEGSLRDVLRRAAASIDTPVALRSRIRLTMERERRSQVGIARAWPAAVAAAILVSFVWHGQEQQTPQALHQLSQAHARAVPMDVVSGDSQVVAHFLRTQLSYTVPVDSIVGSIAGAKPQQMAARIIEQDGRQSVLLRFDFAHGSMSLMVGQAEATQGNARSTSAAAEAGIGVSSTRQASVAQARPLYIAQDAKGLTVAQWQTQGLVYDMVSDLPQVQITTSVQQMAR